MNWERRPERDTPSTENREFHDDRGRTWVGSVSSGRLEGGEEHAEVIFVCRDQPSELKRVARLEEPPARADDRWREMDEAAMLDVFRRAKPA